MVSTDGTSVAEPAATPQTPAPESPRESQPAPPHRQPATRRPKRRRRVDRALVEFQPDAVEIEERPIPGRARWTLYTIILLIISVVTWACLTEVDRVVVAQGKLTTTVSPLIVQPRQTEAIREIKAEFGQRVRPGDVLAILDSDLTQVDVDKVRDAIEAAEAALARLVAERNQQPFDPPHASENIFLMEQRHLFETRREEYRSRTEELQQAIEQYQAELATNLINQENTEERLKVLKDMEETMETLKDRRVNSEFEYLTYKLRRLETEGTYQDLQSKKGEIESQLAQAKGKLEAFRSNWISQINEQILEKQQELRQAQNDLLRATKAQEFTTLIVPEDVPDQEYVVLEVADRAAVAQGEKPLFKLVPIDVPLETEVDIPAKDIGLIRKDQSVRIKLDAFPYQKHGTLDGTVKAISEGSFQKQEGNAQEAVFRAEIHILDGQRLENIGEQVRLMPGMTASCEVKVGHRRVIDYFLYPLLRQLDNSIQEP